MPYKTKNRSDWHQAAFQINTYKRNATIFYHKPEGLTSSSIVRGGRYE